MVQGNNNDRDRGGYFYLCKEWSQGKSSVASVPRDPSDSEVRGMYLANVHLCKNSGIIDNQFGQL